MLALSSLVRRLAVHGKRGLSSGCQTPCEEHPSYPPEILAQIDQGDMKNSMPKYRRHLCIAQSVAPSQWPRDVKDLPGGYIGKVQRALRDKSVKLTATFVDSRDVSEQTTDWYLFPDQLKLSKVPSEHIEGAVEQLFVNELPLDGRTKCERLDGIWVLVCCHDQRDRRCGVAGPMLLDEMHKYIRETNRADSVHCLGVSHIGGHRFAGNVIVYPSGTWYGRVLPRHVPLLIDAYASASAESMEKLRPLLRGRLSASN